jgi:hypothetical protein
VPVDRLDDHRLHRCRQALGSDAPAGRQKAGDVAAAGLHLPEELPGAPALETQLRRNRIDIGPCPVWLLGQLHQGSDGQRVVSLGRSRRSLPQDSGCGYGRRNVRPG